MSIKNPEIIIRNFGRKMFDYEIIIYHEEKRTERIKGSAEIKKPIIIPIFNESNSS